MSSKVHGSELHYITGKTLCCTQTCFLGGYSAETPAKHGEKRQAVDDGVYLREHSSPHALSHQQWNLPFLYIIVFVQSVSISSVSAPPSPTNTRADNNRLVDSAQQRPANVEGSQPSLKEQPFDPLCSSTSICVFQSSFLSSCTLSR